MDRIKKVTGTNDNYDDTYEDDYYDGFDNYEEGAEEADYGAPAAQAPMNGAMGGMNSAPMGGGISLSGANIKMQVVRPRTYDSDTTTQIANHLLNKCTVVLNLENTNRETSRRLIDFLTGVAYSIGGNLKQIATNAYVITPSNVDVENAQIRQNTRRPEPQPEIKETPADDFSDFN
ncbi:MAG: cell division protein SepF [Clostridia bacterium]|nr:cell division protein SepF [Clostridia bacterium]